MDINIGIVGYGGMAGWHHKNCQRIDGIKVVAAYDILPERVEAAKEAGLRGYMSLAEFLDDPEVNLVLIATPNQVHKEGAIAAINAGKHIVVEKPVAMSVAEFDEIEKAAKSKGVLFTVHQNRRWDRDFCMVKKALEDNMLGKAYSIESRVHGSGGAIHGWRALKECGGGMVLDWGVHLIDQILFMLPHKIETIYAQLVNVINKDVDDYFKILIKFENEVSAQIEVGTFCLKSLPRWFVCGNKGTLEIKDWLCNGGITRTKQLAEEIEPEIVDNPAGPTRTFAPQPEETREDIQLPQANPDWTDFYKNVKDVLEGKDELIVKPAEVRRVFTIMEAAFKSNETGQVVRIDE